MAVSDAPSRPISGAFASAFAPKPQAKKAPQAGTDAQRKHMKRMENLAKAVEKGQLGQRYKSKGPQGIGKSRRRGIVRISADGDKITKTRVKRMNITQKKRLKRLLDEDTKPTAASVALFKSGCPVPIKAHCRKKPKQSRKN